VLITIAIYIAATIVTDLVVAWLDPRVRTAL
jgi:ABC-type dipeptide/oligopeptide/nickel transport system permease component